MDPCPVIYLLHLPPSFTFSRIVTTVARYKSWTRPKWHWQLLLALSLHMPAAAQDAVLSGQVIDADNGAAVIGVNVTYAPGKGAATDTAGYYSFRLPPGQHVIAFSSIGFVDHEERIVLAPGEQRRLDVALKVSATQLDMVVISAGRFEQPVGEVTGSLSVIHPELMLNKNIVSLDDALDQVPGMIVVDGEPQIRAGSGFSYGAGSRVQVLVDDIPILSGDIGRPNWTFLPIENLEQVEVVKGASSVLYGSAALSGAINVRTAFPRDEPRTMVTLFSGMYDKPANKAAAWWGDDAPIFSGANFFHSRKFGRFDLVIGGNAYSNNGHVGPEPLPADTIAADPLRLGPSGYDHRMRFNIGTRWRNGKIEGFDYGVNTNVMKSRNTAILIWNDIDSGLYRPRPGTVTRTIGDQFYVDPFINFRSKNGLKQSLRGRLHYQDFQNDNDQSNSNTVYHAEYQVQHEFELFGRTNITAGALYRNVESRALLYSGDADGDGLNSALNLAGYLQIDKKLFDRIALSLGVRSEFFKVNEEEVSQPVFRAGANWQVLEHTFLRASYGQGFRFPTIGERFINTGVGSLNIFPNPDLRPETSTNIEGGVKQGFRIGGFKGYLDLVGFLQEYDDLVEFTFGQWRPLSIADLQDVSNLRNALGFKSVNTGKARVTGLEIEAAGQGRIGKVMISTLLGFTSTLPVSLGPEKVYAEAPDGGFVLFPEYSYNNTSYDPSERILKFRVERLFRSDIQLEYDRFFFGFSVRYNSHVRNIDRIFVDLDEDPSVAFINMRTGIGEWMRTHRTGDTVIDARIGMHISEALRITFIVNNLTNLEYAIRPLAIEEPRNFQVQLSYRP